MRPLDRALHSSLRELGSKGLLKDNERVLAGRIPPAGGRGPRWMIEGEGAKPFLRMNSNSYLGLGAHGSVLAAGRGGEESFGAGPGAVRFISGTMAPHRRLEERLAAYHDREDAMLFSSAYGAVIGVLPALATEETIVFSDELNHNCIINALRIARPGGKALYAHLSMKDLEQQLTEWKGRARRALIVSDGVFSMRGDHAPLDSMAELRSRHGGDYPEGITVVVDDSHGAGAFGARGRGTEEVTGGRADLLVATLGKAFGVNGGYAAGSAAVVAYLRQTAASYIYSNPLTPGEAAAAAAAVEVVDSPAGREMLGRLRRLTDRFRRGLAALGFLTVPGNHPIVPLITADSDLTGRIVNVLYDAGVLVTGLAYPVVPAGQEEIRFQVAADMTEADIEQVLEALELFGRRRGEGRQ